MRDIYSGGHSTPPSEQRGGQQPHPEYGEMKRENVYFQQIRQNPLELGATPEGSKIIRTKEESHYTILQPGGRNLVVSSFAERVQQEGLSTSFNERVMFGVTEEWKNVTGGNSVAGMSISGHNAERIYRMIEKYPNATSDMIAQHIHRIDKAQQKGSEEVREAENDFQMTVSNLPPTVGR